MLNETLDWDKYSLVARKAITEGLVLLKNNNALPIKKGSKVALFGRMQSNYYKSGTGSGGMVNVSKVISILDGLLDSEDIVLNQELIKIYEEWEKEHPFDVGIGWGNEPWSQEEMPVTEELVQSVAAESQEAVVIIARTAGEDKDNQDKAGSYQLTEVEIDLLAKVRKAFDKVTVVLNVGNIIDMSFMDKVNVDAVLYVWQGGMIGGAGVADVLTGKTYPSGKLTDTIAYSIEDYPSNPYFGDLERNLYTEDIYVGYRYFETVAKEKVRFPFGFGLSYTDFTTSVVDFKKENNNIHLELSVANTGNYAGKEVVQIYYEAPQGVLGKPSRNLIAFQKTKELKPSDEQWIGLDIDITDMASYDDSGITGHKSSYVLEPGEYKLFVGNNVRDAVQAGCFVIDQLLVTNTLSEALAPVISYRRMKPVMQDGNMVMELEEVPTSTISESKHREENLPKEIPFTGDKGIKLMDVKLGKTSMEEFIAQLTDDDLTCIIRGEGMGSPKVTPGTAAAFGGVTDSLKSYGIPCGCCSDGPSGMRLDCGTKAFSLPNGTLLACTFNVDLVEELFHYTGLEMVKNKVDTLLGPGMNIHRHPLNGRNFEYFSEDPFVTGKMAVAQLKGMHKAGVTGTIKHFCGNNQETKRHEIDSVISERALREIYLKGFEMAVKEGNAKSIMTTYGSVNGLWTCGSYDLNTTILRKEWGFQGIAMSDWWANINERNVPVNKTNFAAMARSQNDLYMVCPNSSVNSSGDNTMESLKAGTLLRAELQRNAMNICRFLLNTHALDRMNGINSKIEVINYQEEEETWQPEDVIYYKVDKSTTIPLDQVDTSKGSSYAFGMDVSKIGHYKIELTGKSDLGELAQMPITVFIQGIVVAAFTWNGTDGKWITITNHVLLNSKYDIIRFYFGESGIDLKDIKFTLEEELPINKCM